MIFVRLKIEYFFSVFGILLFCSPIIHRKQLYSYLWIRFYELFFDFEGFQLSTVNCQYVGVMLVLCWCYVGVMLVLCRPYVGVMSTLCWCYVRVVLTLCRSLFNRSFLQLET